MPEDRPGQEAANELEEMYRASVGRDRERKRRGLRAEWYCYFSRLAEAHAGISKHFEAKALALLEDDMKGGA